MSKRTVYVLQYYSAADGEWKPTLGLNYRRKNAAKLAAKEQSRRTGSPWRVLKAKQVYLT